MTRAGQPTAPELLGSESIRLVLDAIDRLAQVSAGTGDERGDTRERILSAALRLFAKDGFQATSIRSIAHEVGIKPPGIYSHFGSKESILAAAVSRSLWNFLTFVVEPDPQLGETTSAEFIVRKHVRFQVAHPDMAMPSDTLIAHTQSLQQMDAEHHRVLRDAQRAYVDLLAEAVADYGLSSDAHPRTVAHVVITMCDGVNMWHRPGGWLDAHDLEKYMWRLVDRILSAVA